MDAPAIFVANLPLVERVADRVCRHWRVYGADAEDFVSLVKLALIENDYAILRKWEQRSSLAGYLTVVIQRLLLNERTRVRGRWHASAEATRMGQAAMLLEALIRRDGRSIDEAMPLVAGVDQSLTRAEVESMAARLRERSVRPRVVEIDETIERSIASSDAADAALLAGESCLLGRRAAVVIRDALASFTVEERMIVRFRFASSMTPPKIAAALQMSLRTFYRRLDELLVRLRRALLDADIDAESIESVIDASLDDLDFGLGWHDDTNRPSLQMTAASEEQP
jgi:RNA polymerase sigma factor (sigma-70 family)